MTIQTIRPDADYKVDNWLHEGAGSTNLWQHIDDDPPVNTSFIAAQGNWPGSSYIARLANLGTPLTAADASGPTQRIRHLQIFYTVASHTSNVPEGVYVTLRDAGGAGVPAHALGPRDSSWTKSTTFATHTGFKRTSDPYTGEWKESVVNRLQLEMFSTKNSFAKLGDAWVEVFVDNRPTVGTVTVTDPTTTTKPTVTWVYSDSEDDPQAAFQMKVFKTSDTTAPGFNVNTSPAVWDSGLRYGSADQMTTLQSLVNGQQYTWYVRAAQLFNGKHWWSAWAASTATTIAVTPPTAPTLTAAKDETVPNLRTLLTAAWVAGGGFPSGSITVEYADLALASLNWVSQQVASGGSLLESALGFYANRTEDAVSFDRSKALPGDAGSIRWDVNIANTAGAIQVGTPLGTFTELPPHFIGVKPGAVCVASAYATADATFAASLTVQPCAADGSAVGSAFTSSGFNITTAAMETQRFQVSWTQPATAVGVRFRINNTAPATGRKVWASGWKVREGTSESLPAAPGQGVAATVWRPVRTADEMSAATGTNVYAMDEEQAPGSLRLYRARSEIQVTEATERSSAATYVPTVYMTPAGSSQWVLKDPEGGLPNLQVRVLAGLKESIEEEATDLFPLGREFGVTVSDVIGGLDGTIIFRTEGEREWERLLAFLQAQRTLFLAYPSGGAKFIRLKSRAIDRYGAAPNLYRRVECDYKQRGRPS